MFKNGVDNKYIIRVLEHKFISIENKKEVLAFIKNLGIKWEDSAEINPKEKNNNNYNSVVIKKSLINPFCFHLYKSEKFGYSLRDILNKLDLFAEIEEKES